MTALTSQPWFIWSLMIVIGLPVGLVVLTEAQSNLARRGSAMARPVRLLRNWILPSGALILLLTQANGIAADNTWVRIVATVFGFLLVLLVLAALNVALFVNATRGSWRQRLPSIFVDILRLVLVVAGLAMIFAYVWGADVAGLFTALGVTSVVLGFALQNAVGSIVSGLLLLFEQPFQLGDWLEAGGVRGRVVEVNWRSVHIDVGAGVQIIPNASLAGSSFTNLSRPSPEHNETVESTFAAEDPPGEVLRLLETLATALPMLDPSARPTAALVKSKTYATTIPLTSPSLAGAAASTFQRWLWYAARREGLRLDGLLDDYPTEARRRAALLQVGPTLALGEDDVDALVAQVRLHRFTDGEVVQRAGLIPAYLSFVIEGATSLWVAAPSGERVKVIDVQPTDYLGHSVLTGEKSLSTAYAVGNTILLRLPRDVVYRLIQSRPQLAVDIGQVIEQRRAMSRTAIEALQPPTIDHRPRTLAAAVDRPGTTL